MQEQPNTKVCSIIQNNVLFEHITRNHEQLNGLDPCSHPWSHFIKKSPVRFNGITTVASFAQEHISYLRGTKWNYSKATTIENNSITCGIPECWTGNILVLALIPVSLRSSDVKC